MSIDTQWHVKWELFYSIAVCAFLPLLRLSVPQPDFVGT